MDLRQLGEPFEKKFVQFSDLDVEKISSLFHVWQEEAHSTEYKNIPEFCYSATIEEIKNKDYSLIPSKYIEFVNRDEKIDFDKQMLIFSKEIQSLLLNEKKSNEALVNLFKELGYEINL